jgi:hypothetical protein
MKRLASLFVVLFEGRSSLTMPRLKVSPLRTSQSMGTERFPHCTLDGMGVERARVASNAAERSLEAIFGPKGIAVIGISTKDCVEKTQV